MGKKNGSVTEQMKTVVNFVETAVCLGDLNCVL